MTTNFFSPLSFVAVFGSGIWDKYPGSATLQKSKEKTLIFTALWLLNILLSLKTDVDVLYLQEIVRKKKLGKNFFFVGILKATEEKSRIRMCNSVQYIFTGCTASVHVLHAEILCVNVIYYTWSKIEHELIVDFGRIFQVIFPARVWQSHLSANKKNICYAYLWIMTQLCTVLMRLFTLVILHFFRIITYSSSH